MTVVIVCAVDEYGQSDMLAVEPMLEETEDTILVAASWFTRA